MTVTGATSHYVQIKAQSQLSLFIHVQMQTGAIVFFHVRVMTCALGHDNHANAFICSKMVLSLTVTAGLTDSLGDSTWSEDALPGLALNTALPAGCVLA